MADIALELAMEDVGLLVKMDVPVLALIIAEEVVIQDVGLVAVEIALLAAAILALVALQHVRQTAMVAVKEIVLDAAQLFLAVVVDVVLDVPADALEHALVVVQ